MLLHIVRNDIRKNHDNWLKNKKIIQSQKMYFCLRLFLFSTLFPIFCNKI